MGANRPAKRPDEPRRGDRLSVVPFNVPQNALQRLFRPDELPGFLSYVEQAVQENREMLARFSGTGRWISPAFYFTKRMKLHPKLRRLEAEPAAEVVGLALGEVFQQDKEDFLWQTILGDSDTQGNHVDPYSDFICCWDKLREPGSGALESAFARAQRNPRPPEHFGREYASVNHEGLRGFLAL